MRLRSRAIGTTPSCIMLRLYSRLLASEQYRRVVTRNDDASKDIATWLTV
jgi:hypothetical protein